MENIKTYKAIFESSPDGVIISDHLGTILMVNSQIEKLFGYKKEELIGQKIELIIPKRYHDYHATYRTDFAAKPSVREMGAKKELWANRKDGSEFAVEISLSPIKNEDSTLFSAAIRDVSERKIADKKIVDNEQRFHSTLNNMMEGVQIISFDFRYLYVNDALVKHSGYTREELLGYTMMEKYPGIENTEVFNRIKKCMNDKQGQILENEFTFPDGSMGCFELSIQPSLEGVFILSQDITERKINEKIIVANEKRFHNTIDNLTEGVQIIDYNFRYLYLNNISIAYRGRPKEEFLGYTIMEKYPDAVDTDYFKALQKCMKERVSHTMISDFTSKNQAGRILKVKIIPIDEGLSVFHEDITERINYKLQIESQNKSLKDKNNELEQYTYITSHDLQEPLRALVGFSDLLKEEFGEELGAEGNQYVDFIFKSSKRMQELVKGLMDYSRIGKEKLLVLVDCNVLVNEVLSDLSLLLKESGAKVTVQSLPILKGYEIELRLLFQNLINNAIKFVRKGVTPDIIISARNQTDNWLFSIQDNGIGIDEQDKEKIFVIFKRLHNRNEYEGTGIGLSHCKKIVDLHGGTIWVDSKFGEGSIFNFTINENKAL